MNKVTLPDNTRKAMKLGNKVFKDMYFFYFCNKCAQDMLQNVLFTNDEWGDKLTSHKIVKISKKYM